MSKLTHIDETGRARMVDVSGKPDTVREAVAAGFVRMRPETHFVRMDAQVETVAASITRIEIKALGGERFAVRGQIGVSAKPQVRIYHLVHSLSQQMVRLELLQLACVSLMPFSTAVVGEWGHLPAAAVVYAGNMLAVTVLGALRTRELVHLPRVHARAIDDPVRRALNIRAYGLPAFASLAFILAFFVPGWNLLAMLPMALLPTLGRVRAP